MLGEKTLIEQIENHKPTETSVWLRHPVQTRHYFYEYKKLLEEHRLNFIPELSYQNYFIFPEQNDDPRYKYIQTLISHASHEDRLPVLCFCRSQMRSAWIRRNFIGTHIAQVRDPLAQWESFSIQPFFRNTMIKIAFDLRRSHPAYLSHIPNFDRFAAAFELRKNLPFEQLYEYFLKPDDFFAIFILIWAFSTLQSVSNSDLILDIDYLSADGRYRAFVQEWFADLDCIVDLSDCCIHNTCSVDIRKANDTIIEAGRAIKQSRCAILLYDPAKLAGALNLMCDRSRKAIDLFLSQ